MADTDAVSGRGVRHVVGLWSTTRADSIELVTRMMWAILSNPIGRLPIFSHSYRRRFEAKSFDVEIIR